MTVSNKQGSTGTTTYQHPIHCSDMTPFFSLSMIVFLTSSLWSQPMWVTNEVSTSEEGKHLHFLLSVT